MAWCANASTGGKRRSLANSATTPGKVGRDLQYAASLPLYLKPPEGEVAIEDFELLALERLKVLKSLEEARSKNTKEPELRKIAEDLVKKHLKGMTLEESSRNDAISHFILRLAYCRTEDLRHWYLSQECDLFRFRFSNLPASAQVHFLALHDMPYRQIDKQEFSEVQPLLEAVAYSICENGLAAEIHQGKDSGRLFFKVPWKEVPELVAHRKVLVKKGFAYVPANQLAAIVTGQFRARLSKELAVLARKYVQLMGPDEAHRLTPIVETLSTRLTGKSYDTSGRSPGDEVLSSDLPVLSKHFPLCMLSMYERLQSEHHLRYQGRLQLGLFLKGVGLPLDEALRFWKAAFGPRTPADAWEKQYAYGIRYNYGKEGKRKDFTPYSCIKLVGTVPGVGEHHGCPFKTFDEANLRAALSRMKVSSSFADDAVRKAKGGHYQLACGAAFEGSHGCACDEGIQHPNQYYDESRKLEEPQESLPPTTPAIGATNPMELTTPATDNSYASNKRPVPDSTPTKDMATPSAMPPPKRKISGTPTLAFPTPAKVG